MYEFTKAAPHAVCEYGAKWVSFHVRHKTSMVHVCPISPDDKIAFSSQGFGHLNVLILTQQVLN